MTFESTHRRILGYALIAISIAMAAYHIWAIAFGTPEAVLFRGTHLLFAIVLTFLLYRWTIAKTDGPQSDEQRPTDERLPTLFDYGLMIAGAIPIIYLFVNYEYIVTRIFYIDDLSFTDKAMAVVMVLVVLEATRRVIGLALPITAVVFLLYGLLIARLEPERMLDQLYMTTEGIFGIPLSVSASYVLIFVLFGAFMERTGTGQLFMDFAMALTGHTAGGPGKVSVVSLEPVRHDFRQRRRQRHGGRTDRDSADEALGLLAAFRRRCGSDGVDRRADHAADHGRGRVRDGRVSGGVLRAGHHLGDHSRDSLLRGLLRRGAFRGQALRTAGIAAFGIAAARPCHARARTSVHSGRRHSGRHVFRLQRADGGAGRHRCCASRSRRCAARRVKTSTCRISSRRSSMARATRWPLRWPAPAPAS